MPEREGGREWCRVRLLSVSGLGTCHPRRERPLLHGLAASDWLMCPVWDGVRTGHVTKKGCRPPLILGRGLFFPSSPAAEIGPAQWPRAICDASEGLRQLRSQVGALVRANTAACARGHSLHAISLISARLAQFSPPIVSVVDCMSPLGGLRYYHGLLACLSPKSRD